MAEEVTPDVATWSEIQVTMIFTVATATAFLIIYESSRRNPAVSAVFDRRRASKPKRTPPPLMRSRYFEWLFLSTDPAYLEYSEMAHTREVIRERKRQQRAHKVPTSGGTTTTSSSDGTSPGTSVMTTNTILEEDEPKKKKRKKRGHGRQGEKEEEGEYDDVDLEAGRKVGMIPRSLSSDGSVGLAPKSAASTVSTAAGLLLRAMKRVDSSSSAKKPDDEMQRSGPVDIDELDSFSDGDDDDDDDDGDDDESLAGEYEPPDLLSPRYKDRARKKGSGGRARKKDYSGDEIESVPSGSSRKSIFSIGGGGSSGGGSPSVAHSEKTASTSSSHGKKRHRKALSRTAQILTPDVVEVNGRRLPASIAQYAISGDLTERQLDHYERELIERELEEERRFKERQREMANRDNRKPNKKRARGTSGSDTSEVTADIEVGDDSFIIRAPPRFGYLGFQRRTSSKSILSRFFMGGAGHDMNDEVDDKFENEPIRNGENTPTTPTTITDSNNVASRSPSNRAVVAGSAAWTDSPSNQVNRHLKSTAVTEKRPLSISDEELLRCVGLDTYVMIRFLRFGFDVTFYPFVLACLILIPTYYTNDNGEEIFDEEGDEQVVTGGYFRITMNRLQSGSPRLWVAWGFAILFFLFILWRQWIEWETFIALRFDFLANGDVERNATTNAHDKNVDQKDDVQLHLQQYRNSCMIEFIPESHRRDRELFDFFNAVFPGQVKRAEILLNANTLTKLIAERKRCIEKYENLYAKHFHEKQKYRKKMENLREDDVGICSYICCRCCGVGPKKPAEPKVKIGRKCWCCGCCGKKMVKAMPHYLSEIKRLNREVEMEHRRILEEKQKVEDKDGSHGFFTANLAQGLKYVTGSGGDLTCDTGFVEFKSLTSKQSAIQCNITGTTDYMVTVSAPDPRDIDWNNATVERASIRIKQMQMDILLFTGTLFWSVVVTAITSISNLDKLDNYLPSMLIPDEDTFWYGLIQGYLPVVFLELLMLVVPIILRFIGSNYIRFKSKSELDKFVFTWHFGYRVANLVIIIVKNQIYETFSSFTDNPEDAVLTLAAGISASSQFFLNNMIIAAGTETTWELAQMPNMILHFIMHKFITVEAKSKRALEKLEEADSFNWGEVVPPFIFAFLVGAVYCTVVPLVVGVCAVFFYIATKVYTHQALFVYSQPYEGGGKLMYLLNRTVFTICYMAIGIFGILLGLKDAKIQAPSFFVIMTAVTFLVDRKITLSFVRPSETLALTNSRIIDDENSRKEERARLYQEYKAAKLEKKREAARAARDAARGYKRGDRKDDKSANDSSSLTSSKMPPKAATGSDEKGLSKMPHKPKTIQFQVLKEDGPEQLRQRRPHTRKSGGRGAASSPRFGGDSDEEDDGKYDFYLYRQPQLNKSLWETKPRPYR